MYDWKCVTWSIAVYEVNHDIARAESIIKELQQQVASASKVHRPSIGDLRKVPARHIIQNPFALSYNAAEELIEIAQQLADPFSTVPKLGNYQTPSTLSQSAFFQLFTAAEALLNLVYELYLKRELRDERISQRLAREQIDLKLRLAPIYCDCFTGTPIDYSTDAFRKFQRLVNARSDLIHANVTKSMRQPVVEYDDITFVLDAEDSADGVISTTLSDIGVDEVKSVNMTIDDIVNQILANMEPRYRAEFRSVIHEDVFEVAYEDGIPVIVR